MSITARIRRWLGNIRNIVAGRCEICGTTDPAAEVRVFTTTRRMDIGYRPCRCFRCTLKHGLE